MLDYELLGAFYLGRPHELSTQKSESTPLLYDAKDLTTHAVIVGMTGSGKTGLGITLLEEAAIDGIPAIIIDPKGDMGNLMLTFPQLRGDDFRPWVDLGAATRNGMTPDEFAADQARLWKSGLAKWNQGPERIQSLRDAADVAIYTPGGDAGIPISVLKSLDAPAGGQLDLAALRERVSSTVSGLLTLLGIDADPLRSREHILLSNILEQAWMAGRNLDLPQLIREIQQPPFTRVGIMDLEAIFPSKDRMQLAMLINNVLASPAFAAWTQGAPLSIQKLLYTNDGRPRLSILSIAHLSDSERMFFVTILLNELITWMRTQPGTSSLRAILYMDEVFGYLPPTANPPSKTPLLTLLKQARAYGVGLVLATQNPVDLDYKALSNAGTWFLGRLQTERDKLRVLDGLEGASTTAGMAFDRQKIEGILSGVGKRVFLLNNVHEQAPSVFETRWAMSYLSGPLTRDQIRTLMASRRRETVAETPAVVGASSPVAVAATQAETKPEPPPILPKEISQKYLPVSRNVPRDARISYRPALLGIARVHYVDSKSKTDVWNEVGLLVDADYHDQRDPWDEAQPIVLKELQPADPVQDANHLELPSEFMRAASYKRWSTSLKGFLYRSQPLSLRYCPDLKLYSTPEERPGDFQGRLDMLAREQRDLEIEQARAKGEKLLEKFEDRIRKAEQRVEKEREQASSAAWNAAVSFGSTVLSAFMGRKKLSVTNTRRAASSMRAASRAADQRGDIKRAEETVEAIEEDQAKAEEELEQDLQAIRDRYLAENLTVEPYEIKPRKSDITILETALVWIPQLTAADGRLHPAYDPELFPEEE